MDQREFLQILGGFIATPVEEVFLEYKNDYQLYWYHLLCSIQDFNLIWSCKEFKFHSLCRCHQVADDLSVAHEHVHAVVSGRVLLESWKKQLRRKGIKLHKSTFKRIICADHLAGIFRYLCCKDGQKVGRRGVDGLVTGPHTHYERRVDVRSWLHDSRGQICAWTRDEIETKMKLKLDVPLHDYDTCLCARGRRGIENREEANRKRRAFYDTDEGKAVKERYKRKKMQRDLVIQELQKLGRGPKAELKRKEIERLIKMLKD
jgi:hypothetical protein